MYIERNKDTDDDNINEININIMELRQSLQNVTIKDNLIINDTFICIQNRIAYCNLNRVLRLKCLYIDRLIITPV